MLVAGFCFLSYVSGAIMTWDDQVIGVSNVFDDLIYLFACVISVDLVFRLNLFAAWLLNNLQMLPFYYIFDTHYLIILKSLNICNLIYGARGNIITYLTLH
jgi:hypothetical protein